MRIVIHGKEGSQSLDVSGPDNQIRIGQGVIEVLQLDSDGSMLVRGWPQTMVYHYELYVTSEEHNRVTYL